MKHRFQHALGSRHVSNPLKQTQRVGQHVPAYVALLEGLIVSGCMGRKSGQVIPTGTSQVALELMPGEAGRTQRWGGRSDAVFLRNHLLVGQDLV